MALQPVPGDPPEHANVFSDGGVDIPRHPEAASATIGIWRPVRTPEGEELPRAYLGEVGNYLDINVDDQGEKMCAVMVGRRPSSTRAELMAILAALTSARPERIGSDSACAVRSVSRMLRGPLQPWEKPWQLRANNDLLVLIEKALEERGREQRRS